jgi:hypothetical protein
MKKTVLPHSGGWKGPHSSKKRPAASAAMSGLLRVKSGKILLSKYVIFFKKLLEAEEVSLSCNFKSLTKQALMAGSRVISLSRQHSSCLIDLISRTQY